MAKNDEVVTVSPSTDMELGFNDDSIVGNDQLNAIQSYDEALDLLGLAGVSGDDIQSFLEWDTNPYQPVDKAELVGKPMLIVQWRFIAGDFGGFTVVHAIVRLGNGTDWFVMFTDGSTGICEQLNELTNARLAALAKDGADASKLPRPQNGALVRGGLVASNYEYTDADGKQHPATTYYLTNSTKAKV